MSYAEVASKGPKQTPEEAAAPQPPQIVTDESVSSSSIIDVDGPGVRTVPADFMEQDIKTETQADRIEFEKREKAAKKKAEDLAAKAKAEADLAKKKGKAKARKADDWLTKSFADLGEGGRGAVAAANFVAVVGLSGWLGFKAWGLYDRGRLSWKDIGLGVGILSAVGVMESVLANYISKANKKDHEQ
ncbi:hypothetical protein QBC35DRAFT_418827 [Podospora australis]|uniref:Mitochondrial outer membrane protein OM14 C-terminal domain-containing protein n=1 Tax=Podospora australis TaxID=1536484 RepID=A0AAN6WNM7_9PEZI|nr:hypothetical protein QBC35DRAFT_418827 [Podospora australis]